MDTVGSASGPLSHERMVVCQVPTSACQRAPAAPSRLRRPCPPCSVVAARPQRLDAADPDHVLVPLPDEAIDHVRILRRHVASLGPVRLDVEELPVPVGRSERRLDPERLPGAVAQIGAAVLLLADRLLVDGAAAPPLELVDERFTTAEAARRGAEDLDAGAAVVLLALAAPPLPACPACGALAGAFGCGKKPSERIAEKIAEKKREEKINDSV